jgi:hypothetical protein
LSYSAKSSFKESITFRKYCINPFWEGLKSILAYLRL